jgi:hypothetical protein
VLFLFLRLVANRFRDAPLYCIVGIEIFPREPMDDAVAGHDIFDLAEFHRRCAGSANTLTLIRETDKNVFGGFPSVEIESSAPEEESGCFNDNNCLRSFLFPLMNPPDIPALKFALRAETKQHTIGCDST